MNTKFNYEKELEETIERLSKELQEIKRKKTVLLSFREYDIYDIVAEAVKRAEAANRTTDQVQFIQITSHLVDAIKARMK